MMALMLLTARAELPDGLLGDARAAAQAHANAVAPPRRPGRSQLGVARHVVVALLGVVPQVHRLKVRQRTPVPRVEQQLRDRVLVAKLHTSLGPLRDLALRASLAVVRRRRRSAAAHEEARGVGHCTEGGETSCGAGNG